MTSLATADQNEAFASFRQNMGGDIFQQQNEGNVQQQLLFMEHQQDFMLKQNEKMQAQLASPSVIMTCQKKRLNLKKVRPET